jgi:protein O-GlcNAc transferase
LLLKAFIFYFHAAAVDEGMLIAHAHQMYKAGNFKQALEHCNAVYERNPQRTDNLLLLGAIHYQVV